MWAAAFKTKVDINALNQPGGVLGLDENGNATVRGSLTTPGGTIAGPQTGAMIGYAQSAYPAPNPTFTGSVTAVGPQPSMNLQSIYGSARAAFFLDMGQNLNIQSYSNGGRINAVTTNGALQVQDTTSSAAIWLVPSSNKLVPITADAKGGLGLGNAATSVSIGGLSLKFPAIPQASPGAGAHFVCVDDAGEFYRSDSECQQ